MMFSRTHIPYISFDVIDKLIGETKVAVEVEEEELKKKKKLKKRSKKKKIGAANNLYVGTSAGCLMRPHKTAPISCS